MVPHTRWVVHLHFGIMGKNEVRTVAHTGYNNSAVIKDKPQQHGMKLSEVRKHCPKPATSCDNLQKLSAAAKVTGNNWKLAELGFCNQHVYDDLEALTRRPPAATERNQERVETSGARVSPGHRGPPPPALHKGSSVSTPFAFLFVCLFVFGFLFVVVVCLLCSFLGIVCSIVCLFVHLLFCVFVCLLGCFVSACCVVCLFVIYLFVRLLVCLYV